MVVGPTLDSGTLHHHGAGFGALPSPPSPGVAPGTFFFHLTGRTLANCEVAELDIDSRD